MTALSDTKLKEAEATEILAALARAGVPWDPKVASGDCEGFEEMTAEQKHDATQSAIDAFEKIGEALRQAGEVEVADNYFSHPRQLDDLRGYLPK